MAVKTAKKGARHSAHRREGPRGTTWWAVVDLARDPVTGRRRQRRVSAPTRDLLEEEIARVKQADQQGGALDDRITVAAFLERWLAAIEPVVKPNTTKEYRACVNNWIVPAIGQVRLTKLTALHIQSITQAVLGAGRSGTTAQKIYAITRVALNQAVAWRLVPANVCAAVKAPRRTTREMQCWTAEETARALRAAAGDPLECLWRLAVTTGMRRGELLGLRWQDIDVERRQLAVRHTLVRAGEGRWESSTPKTLRSARAIALSDQMIQVLKRQRAKQAEQRLAAGDRWNNDRNLVFTGDRGRPLSASHLQRQFDHLLERAAVKTIRIHDLRHTAATLMLANGEHPKIVAERLGHSSVKMTLDLYSHVTESMQRDAADRMERLLEGAS